jgi:hypothetical protein
VADIWTNAFFDDAGSNAVAIRLESQRQGRDLTDDDIETITRIARDRAERMQQIKELLQAGNKAEALRLMEELFGFEQRQ